MQSKNKKAPTAAEQRWLDIVKQLDCSVCDHPGPSEIHEMEQGKWFLSSALCPSCHRSPFNGIHGQARIWSVKKMTELDALAVTVARVHEQLQPTPSRAQRSK